MRLRSIRKSHGLTMKELGSLVGVSESTISYIESGRRNPGYELLLKLGEALDCSVTDIIGDGVSGSPSPSPALSAASSPEEIMLVAYRELNDEGRIKVYDYILDLLRSGRYEKEEKYEKTPV